MRGEIKINLNNVSFKRKHDDILDTAIELMKSSKEYSIIKKKYDPAIELKDLKLEWYCGDFDILALNKGGTIEVIEVKSNGIPLFEARDQLIKRNRWILENKDIVEKYVLYNSFEKIDNIVCYQNSSYIIFHDIDVYDKYWSKKSNEHTIPDKVQYKRMILGNYTLSKKHVKRILRDINNNH